MAVDLPEVADDVEGCDQNAVDAMDDAVVEQASQALVRAAEQYADDDRVGTFEAVVSDVSKEQGRFIDVVNQAAIDAGEGEEAIESARRAANDRVDDARIRAGLLVWDALRAAEASTGRTDLLSDEQRAAWRDVAETEPAAALTPLAELNHEQLQELGRRPLNQHVIGERNWGDDAEGAFVDGMRG